MVRLVAVAIVAASLAAGIHGQVSLERWRLVEVWRSGGDGGRGLAYDFVIDMQLAPNGHLLVLVGGDRPALVSVDNTGEPVRWIGGTQAPPLLEQPNGFVQLRDGRIVINDPLAGRFSVISEAGRYLRTIEYQPWGYNYRWLGFAGPDGALYEPVPDGGRLVWRRWSADFAASQLLPPTGCDLGLSAASPDSFFSIAGRERHISMPVPFLQPLIGFVRATDGSSWTGIGPDYREIVRTPWRSCEDVARIILDGQPVRVPPAQRLAEQQRVRDIAAEAGSPVVPDVERVPATFPLFETLRVDPRDRLWVERRVAPAARAFVVYGSDGRRRAEVARVPIAIEPTRPVAFSDNHLFAFTTEESGWTWLVALRIERVR